MTSASARLLEKAIPGPAHILYNQTHREIQNSLAKFIDTSVNPHVDTWEEQRSFPMHSLFKQLASFGIFGANKPATIFLHKNMLTLKTNQSK
ncbi:isovaleryl-CoA dehydrogenase [Aphelenchoides avenae]|nr:isovaleryl-CoA dehydrogenase [Aphelenchus avenae]